MGHLAAPVSAVRNLPRLEPAGLLYLLGFTFPNFFRTTLARGLQPAFATFSLPGLETKEREGDPSQNPPFRPRALPAPFRSSLGFPCTELLTC